MYQYLVLVIRQHNGDDAPQDHTVCFTDGGKRNYAGHNLFIGFDTQIASLRSHCTDLPTPVYFPAVH